MVAQKSWILKGKPELDAEQIKGWWEEELREAGYAVQVQVQAMAEAPREDTWGLGKALLAAVVLRTHQTHGSYRYSAEIAGLAWPCQGIVVTDPNGHILSVHVAVRFPFRASGPGCFIREMAWVGHRGEFEGEGAERLNANPALAQSLKDSLNLTYVKGSSMFEIKRGTYQWEPVDAGTQVYVTTLLRVRDGFFGIVKSTKHLGVDLIVPALAKLEVALQAP